MSNGRKVQDRSPNEAVAALLGYVAGAAAGGEAAFAVGGQPIPVVRVAQDYTALFAWRAEQLHEFCVGRNLGFRYRRKAGAAIGYEVDLESTGESMSEVLLYTVEAMVECLESLPRSARVPGAVDLDSVVAKFLDAMQSAVPQGRPQLSSLVIGQGEG